ncbi:MAG: hypothetical protein U0931_34385 [Vulcanimicrobiota bacterium]
MAINNIGINTQSFGVQRQGAAQNVRTQNEVQPSFNDGFQSSGMAGNPDVNPTAGQPAPVTLTVTAAQLGTQAFQATLTSLASAGIPVSVVIATEGAMQASPSPAQTPPAQANTQQQIGGYNLAGQPKPPAPPAYTPPPRHQTPRYGGD